MGNTPQVFDAFRRILKDALSDAFFLRMRVFGKSIGEEGKAIFLKEIHGPMVGNFDALIY